MWEWASDFRKGSTLWCIMFPSSGLQGLFISAPQWIWILGLSVCDYCSWAVSLAPILRKSSQHSASHLSDRCLPPKQWVIAVLHLSGRSHLVWSAAPVLLFTVIAWHPQSAYQAPFFGHATQMLCLCLALFVCVSSLFSTIFFSSPFPSSLHSFFPTLSRWPRHPNQMNKQIMFKEREQKEGKDVLPPGE